MDVDAKRSADDPLKENANYPRPVFDCITSFLLDVGNRLTMTRGSVTTRAEGSLTSASSTARRLTARPTFVHMDRIPRATTSDSSFLILVAGQNYESDNIRRLQVVFSNVVLLLARKTLYGRHFIISRYSSYSTTDICASQLSVAMKMSELLSLSPRKEEDEAASSLALQQLPQDQAPSCSQTSAGINPTQFTLVPDNKRKHPYKMSAAQRQQRQEYQAYESRVYNLTLDINELRQQIQQLMERRDLHSTRLALNKQWFEGDVLKLTRKYLDGLSTGGIGLSPSARGFFRSRTHISQRDPDASGGVHQYVLQQGRRSFSNRTFTINSMRVLAMVDTTTPGADACEIRRVCGNAGGCVVEVVAKITGKITRDTLVALFPHIFGDEVLVSRVIGQQITFSSRLLLYFNTRRRLMQQVAQADLVAALNSLHLDESSDFTALTNVADEHEV